MQPLQQQDFTLQKSYYKNRREKINICYVTLHVGLGTFRPVSVSNIEEHEMHSEFYSMSDTVASILNETKARGKRLSLLGQPQLEH